MLKIPLNKLISFAKDKNAWLALIAGCALTFAYAPFSFWPLTFVCLVTAFYVTDQPTPKQAAKYGFLFGFGWFALGISWVHVSIAQFGGLPIVLSLMAMAMLCAYLALYPALAFAFATRYSKSPLQRFALLISGLAITEYLRGTLFTGFPWLSFGYTLTDSPLNTLAPWIGEFGLTILCIIIAYALYWLINYKQYKAAIITMVPVGIAYLLSMQNTDTNYSGKHLKTLLVQGNIQQSLRWEPEQFWPTMSKYQDMTRPNWTDVDLVVWPEAAIPEIEDYAFDYLVNLDKAAAFNNTALITGIPDYQFDTRSVYNTLIVLGKKHQEDTEGQYQYLHRNRYQKHQLLPIGEFVPFEDLLRPLAPLFDLPMSSFSRGDAVQNNLLANGIHVLPAICYEIAFSELVRGNYTTSSDILFTVSNDAWFGDSHGPHQHMQIARMRALELQRPMVRVTNNGISGVYDPISHQQVTIAQFTSGILSTDLKLISGHSFFSKHGHTPVWILVGILLLLVLAANSRNYLSSKMEKAFF